MNTTTLKLCCLILFTCTGLASETKYNWSPLTLFSGYFLEADRKWDCHYEKINSCPTGYYCVNQDLNDPRCIKIFDKELLKIKTPFARQTPITCKQGSLSPQGRTHSFLNTAFALDLYSPEDEKVSYIYAGVSGKVIAYSQCKTINDMCGNGFGNHVKILMPNGFMVFYAHLTQVQVKTGDNIFAGQIIGTAGRTGMAGPRHLHLSVHYDWRSYNFNSWKLLGFTPYSVPFELNYKYTDSDSKPVYEDIRLIKCQEPNFRSMYIF